MTSKCTQVMIQIDKATAEALGQFPDLSDAPKGKERWRVLESGRSGTRVLVGRGTQKHNRDNHFLLARFGKVITIDDEVYLPPDALSELAQYYRMRHS